MLLNIWEALSHRVHEIDNPFDFMTSIETDLESEEGRKNFFNTLKVMQDKRHAFFKMQ